MTSYIFNIISLLGGLALFLFGMDTMGKALERQAGGKLQTILAKMSSTVIKGFLLGAAVTAVIQSSSATTVMVVGFVNSGIMTLKQAVGVIMGSNVGTTITSWVLSLSGLEGDSFLIKLFKPSTLAPLIGAFGIVLFMGKSESKKGIGTIMLGFMALMTGMDLMGDSMEFLETEPWFAQLMISFSNPIIGILFGAILTAVIQSSSASVGILQGLCVTGAVTYGAALPIILGQNIGTCITALMGSIGANRNARRTAIVHLLFNVVGVALFVVIFYGIGLVYPWAILNQTAEAWDIAIIHTAFNITATAVLLPMNGLLVKLAYLVIPREQTPQKQELLDERLLGTPAVAVQRAHEITGRMANLSAEALEKAISLTHTYDADLHEQVKALEEETDQLQDALGTYLVKLSGNTLAHRDNRILNTLLYSISDVERIADHAVSLANAAKEMSEKSINFSDAAKAELAVLERAVLDVVDKTVRAFESSDLGIAMKIEPEEQVIDSLVREVKSRHVRRLRDGKCTVEYGFVLDDLLTSYERIADHCSNVAAEMIQTAADKMEVHEYLEALKKGELDESKQYLSNYERYSQRYTFPEEG
ncbi:MAG: Na/Pi cotransporter family protein [Oscillospiraceae bacterium]|nr:Na/Pi cotransporter family protein [Oscillospiraceae bacterium]